MKLVDAARSAKERLGSVIPFLLGIACFSAAAFLTVGWGLFKLFAG